MAKNVGNYEEEKLYTKAQLKVAVTKTVIMLTDMLKESTTKEVVLTILTELHDHQDGGKIKYEDVEKICKKIIERK